MPDEVRPDEAPAQAAPAEASRLNEPQDGPRAVDAVDSGPPRRADAADETQAQAAQSQPPPAHATPASVDYEPPWREARRRVSLAWACGGPGARVALALGVVVAAGLLGAFLFGLWHVVVGGFVKGNWKAGGFGIALASVTGVLLWIEASIARRVLPAAMVGDKDPPPAAP